MSKGHFRLAAIIADIDQVGLSDNPPVRVIGTPKAYTSTDKLCRELLGQIDLRGSDIAVSQANRVELRHRSAGREVYVNGQWP